MESKWRIQWKLLLLGGSGGLVSRLITPISHMTTQVIALINLLIYYILSPPDPRVVVDKPAKRNLKGFLESPPKELLARVMKALLPKRFVISCQGSLIKGPLTVDIEVPLVAI